MSDGLVLYSHPVSSNALRARFLLALLELPYETVPVPLGQPRPDWYLALNPFARIPTLADGELTLAESNAILRYLAHRERRFDLYPEDARGRARVDWALDAFATLVRPPLFPLKRAALFHRDLETGGGSWEEGDPAAIETVRGPAEAALDAFEQFVSADGTVLSTFTIADCSVAPVLWRTFRLPLEFTRWPKLARLREAVAAHPAFAAAGPVG